MCSLRPQAITVGIAIVLKPSNNLAEIVVEVSANSEVTVYFLVLAVDVFKLERLFS
jgi:hypothetical protein